MNSLIGCTKNKVTINYEPNKKKYRTIPVGISALKDMSLKEQQNNKNYVENTVK